MSWLRVHRPILLALVLLLSVGLGACGDSTKPEDPDLRGSYELVSLTLPGQARVEPPDVNGSLDLTATTYTVDISFTIPDQDPISESGTYQLDGEDWTQESGDGTESSGTWVYEDGLLTTDLTSDSGRTVTVWRWLG